ncbi:MAG: hypothetical protein VX421_00895 [Pseudomonadota bacterium]|nr:hypothetical protein [Pseudomonadota bacterium]
MASEDEYNSPGTAQPAKVRKAACGIRFDEDELQEGIDFSGAAELKPGDESPESAAREEHRKPHRHP